MKLYKRYQTVQKDNKQQNKQRIKPAALICIALFIIALAVGTYLLITHIRQRQAEIEKHRLNAVTNIEYGMYNMASTAETIIVFYSLVEQAGFFAGKTEYEKAIEKFEEAKQVAGAVAYKEGVNLAESGIEEMHERIIEAKRNEARELFSEGNQLYEDSQYFEALEYFYKALEIYLQLEDEQGIALVETRISSCEQKLAEIEQANQEPPPDDVQDDTDTQDNPDNQSEVLSNYEFNRSISFDMRTLIDNQNQSPANRIRMGSTDGLNEGWYNGCGWVATYNAMIIMENPKHPAEIVKHFEERGGVAFGGVFGTYPNAIEEYVKSFGYSVNHTLFPQMSMNIDDAIKNSKVSILAYLHTNAAHYVTIVYNEDIDKFIVYNDSFARARSVSLGFQEDTNIGAAIDSVAALINNTRGILFSFSLITIN